VTIKSTKTVSVASSIKLIIDLYEQLLGGYFINNIKAIREPPILVAGPLREAERTIKMKIPEAQIKVIMIALLFS
jgi:hypothetical protein